MKTAIFLTILGVNLIAISGMVSARLQAGGAARERVRATLLFLWLHVGGIGASLAFARWLGCPQVWGHWANEPMAAGMGAVAVAVCGVLLWRVLRMINGR